MIFQQVTRSSTIPGTLALKLDAAAQRAGLRVPGRGRRPDLAPDARPDDPGPGGGESTLVFNNLKENQGISDNEFAFTIPRGVDVITDGTHK